MEKFRTTCSLCEACCAGVAEIEDDRIVRMRADTEDPLSGGYICVKGASIPNLEDDPSRLRQPMLRRGDRLEPASWQEAFEHIQARLPAIQAAHGANSVAIYMGNGGSRSLDMTSYIAELLAALRTQNIYTSGTVDQIPLYVVNALLYGNAYSVAVPDLDRCGLIWILGANPGESNGSMVTAPGFLGRLQKIQDKGGRVVVFDPRRTLTAKRASEYLAIRPSADAAFLAAVAHVLWRDGPAPSPALELCGDLTALGAWLAPFTPDAVASACDIDAATIERLALELKANPAAAVYGRMGTTTQHFSSLTCWLIALVNILAGNLDTVGGAMFAKPLYAQPNTSGKSRYGRGAHLGRWRSRVRKAAEVCGELPVSCLPEEIETPGEGQVRALILSGANPALSNPDPARMERALRQLDLLISIDIYVNESNRHAHVILPSPPRLTRHHYDNYFYQFAIRNYGRYTHAYRALRGEERSERELLLRLAAIARGEDWRIDVEAADERSLVKLVSAEVARAGSRIEGRDPQDILASLKRLEPRQRRLDFQFRVGPWGDAFGACEGITFESLRDAPAGLDRGPLTPRLPEVLRTKSGTIELLQPFVTPELERLARWIEVPRPRFVLVGRRQLRSLNSAMHNLKTLEHKTRRCTLTMNPTDAEELGVSSGEMATVSTARGAVDVEVEVTDDVARGVVSLPHGWGHAALTDYQAVAAANPGANVNTLTDPDMVDPLTGTLQVNGFAVDIAPTPSAPGAPVPHPPVREPATAA